MANDDLKSPGKDGKSIAKTRSPDSASIFSATDVDGLEHIHESTQSHTQLNRSENPQIPRDLIGAGDTGSDYEVSSSDIHGSGSLKNSVRALEQASNNLMGSNAEVNGGITSNVESEVLLRIPNCDFQVVSGYSTFPSHGNVFSGLAQNMSDPTRSEVNLGIARARSSNVRSNHVRHLNAQSANEEWRQSLPGHVVRPTKPQDVGTAELLRSGLGGVKGQPVVPSFTRAAGLQSTVHQGVAASGPSPKKARLGVDSADGHRSTEASNLKRGANVMQTLRSSPRIQEKRQKATQPRAQRAQTQAPTHQLPFWPPHLRRRRTNIARPPPALAPQASPSPPPPPARPSSPVPPQPNLVPAAHIKCPDMDHPPPSLPMGRKCYMCKRDLTFTPEGLVYQPDLPPAVAVLACGHAFHDHCLQVITPQDQAENPPCIPCAIGES